MTEREIYLQALRCEPDDRPRLLDELCRGRPELRARVDRLLSAGDSLGDFLERPLTDGLERAGAIADRTGMRIGAYQLIRLLGHGGMGDVYEAEQTSPFFRRVAVKLIRGSGLSADALARFESERQTLALMDHPHIAKMLDGGNHEGCPYFVMELIPGVPITDYCNSERLNLQQRMDIFEEVCLAVQHAHQKGIIHRDLKPSNVLVTKVDGRAVPKIIDFGVAKITQSHVWQSQFSDNAGQDHASAVQQELLVGTWGTMSPEQTRSDASEVDTRSDIYSLGILCYELLTGVSPMHGVLQGNISFEGIVDAIRHRVPLSPSRCIEKRSQAPSGWNSNTLVRPSQVREDLDWFVMKCLEKDPSLRYPSVESLVRDLQRFSDGEPVAARPATRAYIFRKFMRRYRRIVLPFLIVFAVTCLGLIISTGQMLRAWKAEARLLNESQTVRLERDRAVDAEQVAATERSNALKSQREEATQRGLADAASAKARRQAYAARINLACTAWQSGDIARALLLLDELRPRFDEDDYRGFEWFYLWNACHPKLLSRLDTGNGQYFALKVIEESSPTGHVAETRVKNEFSILLAGWSGVDQVDFTSGGQLLMRRRIGSGNNWSVDVSPNRQTIMTGGTTSIPWSLMFWDAQSAELRTNAPPGIFNGIRGAAYSPDGTRVAGCGFGMVKVWDAQNVSELAQFERSNLEKCLTWISDQQFVSAGHDGKLTLWRLDDNTLTPVYSVEADTGAIYAVEYSASTETLVTAGDQVRLWKVPELELLSTLDLGASMKWDASFSPDGRCIVVAGDDRMAYVLETETGDVLETYPHEKPVSQAAFAQQGRLIITSSTDGCIQVWDRSDRTRNDVHAAHPGKLLDAAFLNCGKVLSISSDETRLWSRNTLDNGSSELVCEQSWPSVYGAVSSDGGAFAILSESEAVILDGISATRIAGVPADGKMNRVALSRDKQTIALWNGMSQDIRIHDWSKQRTLNAPRINTQSMGVASVAFSTQGQFFAIGYPHWLTAICNGESAQPLVTFNQDENSLPAISALAFSRDEKCLATGTSNGVVRVWRSRDGSMLSMMTGHTEGIRSLVFSRDGQSVASCSTDATVRLWDTQTGQERITLGPFASPVVAVSFNEDDSELLVATERGDLRLMRADKKRSVRQGNLELDRTDPTGALGLVNLLDKEFRAGNDQRVLQLAEIAVQRLERLIERVPDCSIYAEDQNYIGRVLAKLYIRADKPAEAERVLREFIAKSQHRLPPESPLIGKSFVSLGECLVRDGKADEAIKWLEKGEAIHVKAEPENPSLCEARFWRGLAEIRCGNIEIGAAMLTKLQDVIEFKKGFQPSSPQVFVRNADYAADILKEAGLREHERFWKNLKDSASH